MLDNLILLNKEEKGYNTRLKCWVDEEGVEHPYELMCSSRRIFGGGYELSEFSEEVERRLEYCLLYTSIASLLLRLTRR